MPRPRKVIKPTPIVTIEMSESILETALLQALQPIRQEIDMLTQETLKLQQQLTVCLEAQTRCIEPLPQAFQQILIRQSQMHQDLRTLLRQLDQESTQSDLAAQLEKLVQSLRSLSIGMQSNTTLQQQISASLPNLNQRLNRNSANYSKREDIPF